MTIKEIEKNITTNSTFKEISDILFEEDYYIEKGTGYVKNDEDIILMIKPNNFNEPSIYFDSFEYEFGKKINVFKINSNLDKYLSRKQLEKKLEKLHRIINMVKKLEQIDLSTLYHIEI